MTDVLNLVIAADALLLIFLIAANLYWLHKASAEDPGAPTIRLAWRELPALAATARAALARLSARQASALLLASCCLLCVPLVLLPLPPGTRAIVVMPVALLAPGFCVTRLIGIRQASVELALAFPISGALWVATAQAEVYLHAWYPRVGFALVFLASGASLIPELRRLTAELRGRAAA